jgi:hypothetical protein
MYDMPFYEEWVLQGLNAAKKALFPQELSQKSGFLFNLAKDFSTKNKKYFLF